MVSLAPLHSDDISLNFLQQLLRSVSPTNGRVLIYVWATDQDENSKRILPATSSPAAEQSGVDVFVPWVFSPPINHGQILADSSQVFKRFYHLFAPGELRRLAYEAADSMGLSVGPPNVELTRGVQVVKDGYERSNLYIELKRWSTTGR